MANSIDRAQAYNPLILTVPGLANSGPEHWQTLWEQQIPDCQRVDLGMWDRPHRNTWVNKLNLAIHRVGRPVILVAHSLGCLTVAWWAKYEQPPEGHQVLGALLVAPPEVDFFPADERLAKFAPTPVEPLPFPSIFAASPVGAKLGQSLCRCRSHRSHQCRFGHWRLAVRPVPARPVAQVKPAPLYVAVRRSWTIGRSFPSGAWTGSFACLALKEPGIQRIS